MPTIWFPNNESHQLAVLIGSFRHLLFLPTAMVKPEGVLTRFDGKKLVTSANI